MKTFELALSAFVTCSTVSSEMRALGATEQKAAQVLSSVQYASSSLKGFEQNRIALDDRHRGTEVWNDARRILPLPASPLCLTTKSSHFVAVAVAAAAAVADEEQTTSPVRRSVTAGVPQTQFASETGPAPASPIRCYFHP